MSASRLAPAASSLPAAPAEIGDFEGEPERRAHASPDFDQIDQFRLRRGEDLDRGASRIEHDAARVALSERVRDGQAQRFVPEGECLVVIVDGEGDADFEDGTFVGHGDLLWRSVVCAVK